MAEMTEKMKFLLFNFYRKAEVSPLKRRVISYMDLTYCLEGEMEYYLNDERIILHAGDAILYPPGSIRQRIFADAPAHYASFNISFPDGFDFPIQGYLPKCIRPNTAYMLETFKKEFESVSAFKHEKCSQIFMYLYYQLMESAFDRDNPHIKLIKQYITEHLAEQLCLEGLAAHVHLEPHYLSNLFKKHTGMTVMKYIIMQRIDLAKRLIVTRDLPLHEIAVMCGFESYKYFSQTFHKITGITAMQYRKIKACPE